MHRPLCLLATALSIAGLASLAGAAENFRPIPLAKPTTQPATRPSATVTPEAAPVLAKLGEAYLKLESLELGGEVTFKVEFVDKSAPRVEKARFTSVFAAPNRFRHQAESQPLQSQPLLGSTGENLYAYSQASRLYMQRAIAPERFVFSDLPPEHQEILADQNLSLVLAITRDPALELKQLATTIEKIADEQIDGQPHLALRLVLRAHKIPLTLLIDPRTHLIRRSVADLMPLFRDAGRKDIASAEVVTDYTAVKPGAEVAGEQFAWAPPAGTRSYTSAKPAGGRAVKPPELLRPVEPEHALVGKPAPDFTLPGLDGKPVKLSDLKGSVVVLEFWATWCGPCAAAFPSLQKLHEDLSKSGLKVYAVNLKEENEKIVEYMKEKGLTMPVLLDGAGEVADNFEVDTPPQTVLIGKDGVITKVQLGLDAAGEEAMRAAIEAELKKELKR